MEDRRASIFAREGKEFPGATYKEVVLEPAYEQAKQTLLPAMLAANRAHLIMLVEQDLPEFIVAGHEIMLNRLHTNVKYCAVYCTKLCVQNCSSVFAFPRNHLCSSNHLICRGES